MLKWTQPQTDRLMSATVFVLGGMSNYETVLGEKCCGMPGGKHLRRYDRCAAAKVSGAPFERAEDCERYLLI